MSDETQESKNITGSWVRETINPLVLNGLVYGLLIVMLYDVYHAFNPPSGGGLQHLGAALAPFVLVFYIILKTEGRRELQLGPASILFAVGAAAIGYFFGGWFRPSLDAVYNVLVMSAVTSVLLLLRARTEGELTYDVAYGLLLGLLVNLALGV